MKGWILPLEERLKSALVPLMCAALVLGCVLRFVGLTRGDLGDDEFHHFHPDQQTLINAALRLQSPTDPPLTAYGLLPIYLAAGALKVAELVAGYPADLSTESGQRLAVLSVRTLSALLSCLTLWVLWILGRRYFGRAAACIAVTITAVAPLAVQQAHFYTVDGVFTLIIVAAFYAMLVASERGDLRLYLLCGALVGAAGAVRLNGLLVGLILLAIHLGRPAVNEPAGIIARVIAKVDDKRLWLSGLAAVLTLVVIQPYIVTDPGRLTQSVTPDDLAYSVQVARGDFLRIWSLVDVHTVPYLHFWTALWPSGVGWPLTLAFLVSVGYALWRRRWQTALLVLWLVLYFVPIGGLHTKHVRYLLPMLPFLGLLFGDMVRRSMGGGGSALVRNSIYVLSTLVVAHAAFYGIAFARVYHTEDSRLVARRWFGDNLPSRARIGVEHGGFSMEGVLSAERLRLVSLNMGIIFGSRGYLSCEASSRILRRQLAAADFVTITDVNRYRQFTAVPELFPVASAFYTDLVGGNLGFNVVERFKVYPEFAGFTFRDDEAEPSFIGYDHPAVIVLRKSESFAEVWDSWQRRFHADEACARAALGEIAEAMAAGQNEVALQRTRALRKARPDLRFVAMIEAYLLQRLQRPAQASDAADSYSAGYGDPSISPYLVAPATALSLMSAGLDDLGLAVLEEAAGRKDQFAAKAHAPMARAYGVVAELQRRDGKKESAYGVHLLAAQLYPSAGSYNALAEISSSQGNYDQALIWWDESLKLEQSTRVHRRVAHAALEATDYPRVIEHLQRVLDLQPAMQANKRRDTLNLLGALSDSTGQYERAQQYWRASLSLDGNQAQIHRHLGLLLLRLDAEAPQSLMHLQKAVELAPALRPRLEDLIDRLKTGAG